MLLAAGESESRKRAVVLPPAKWSVTTFTTFAIATFTASTGRQVCNCGCKRGVRSGRHAWTSRDDAGGQLLTSFGTVRFHAESMHAYATHSIREDKRFFLMGVKSARTK